VKDEGNVSMDVPQPLELPRDVIVWGRFPLTETLVDRVCAFFEWVLDVKLNAAVRMLLRVWAADPVLTYPAQSVIHYVWAA
jgi:hypothetical protein